MTEPTSEGSVKKKFIKNHYPEDAISTAIGFETDSKEIKIENYIGGDIPYNMEISLNEGTVEVSEEIKKEEYKKRKSDLEREIPRLEKELETEEDEELKSWGVSKLKEMKDKLKEINKYLDKNNSKEER